MLYTFHVVHKIFDTLTLSSNTIYWSLLFLRFPRERRIFVYVGILENIDYRGRNKYEALSIKLQAIQINKDSFSIHFANNLSTVDPPNAFHSHRTHSLNKFQIFLRKFKVEIFLLQFNYCDHTFLCPQSWESVEKETGPKNPSGRTLYTEESQLAHLSLSLSSQTRLVALDRSHLPAVASADSSQMKGRMGRRSILPNCPMLT